MLKVQFLCVCLCIAHGSGKHLRFGAHLVTIIHKESNVNNIGRPLLYSLNVVLFQVQARGL